MTGKSLGQRSGEDLCKRGIQGVDQLRGGRGEIGWFLGFVVLHYWAMRSMVSELACKQGLDVCTYWAANF